jgi:hypothetical protein
VSDEINALLDRAHIPTSVKTAAAALALTGLACGMLGVQNLTLVHWLGAWIIPPLVLLVGGAAALVVGAKLMHARRWSLWAALVTSSVLSLGCVAFLVLSVMSGVFSSIAVLAACGAVIALVLTAVAVGPFRGLQATRARLRDAGYDLDL